MHDNPRKKVLFIITKSNFGGAQRYVFELATALDPKNYEVAVACGGNGELVTKLQNERIETFEITGSQRDISLTKEIQALFSLAKIIRSYRPDVVHLNSSKVGLLGSFIARLTGVPKIVFTAHGWPFLEQRTFLWRSMAWLGSYITSIFSHEVIVVSDYDFKHSYMPGCKSKTTVIHTALSQFTLRDRTAARETLFPRETIDLHMHDIWLVTHGEINHNKNHAAAIAAIASFNHTHATKIFYVIIGSGELTEVLREQIEQADCSEYVYFLGYLKEAREYLQAFDMYLMPSNKEGLPYALLEAGFAGLPCIASRVGGIPEVIVDRETGLLINPKDYQTIVTAIDYLLTNPDKRSLYTETMSKKLASEFSKQQLVLSTEKIYQN